jgi:hypothetical protein
MTTTDFLQLALTVVIFALLCAVDRIVFHSWKHQWRKNLFLVLLAQVLTELIIHFTH